MSFAALNRMVAPLLLALALGCVGSYAASAQEVRLQITVQNRQFQPSTLTAPVNRPIVITIKNLDSTPMEFESHSLKVEKVIAAKGQGSVRIRPLAPGTYEFFDDFHQSTRGTLVVK